jgi:glutamate dehydrogenase
MYSLLNIIKVANETNGNIQLIARMCFEVSDRLELNSFRETINDYPSETHWMLLARSAAKSALDFQQRALPIAIYTFNKKNKLPLGTLDAWFEKNAIFIERWKCIFADMKASQSKEYEMLLVTMRELAELGLAVTSHV